MEQARTRKSICRRQGFTLIELLIVVAIIAILAAIAVPNFLEAQTRSKVSRTLADMRTIRTGLESYYVDNNVYPETDLGVTLYAAGKRTYFRLTSPVAYLTSIPQSPFKEKYGTGGAAKVASTINGYLYVRKKHYDTTANPPFDSNYEDDRYAYVIQGALAPVGERRKGEWLMKSVGPDNIDDRQSLAPGYILNARVYDPTNGTTSRGDIVTFSDISGTGKNQ